MNVTYYTLLQGSPETALQPVLDLNNQIFQVDTAASGTHHGSLTEWQKRLGEPLSIIVCAGLNGQTQGDTEISPVGFIFAHPKQHGGDSQPALHIWLAGVLPASRGSGTFHGLMTRVERHAREKDVKTLSVATFPAKFSRMYSILRGTGWSGEKDLGGGKVLLTKALT
ncbi:uncharacterized protein HMPREF1541_02014 [Cyphellophora europaea CBS 101466]|uniref:N-acetyltransferase domain-containing protein n=1 Tax=Cyphellophora europaea (strain CBS 101466) TaxID=1220924 RepID=W2S2C0_CYPE1|nr:uncharacterized protein HMPREF1541_02014 [Cyphellophora europaea CBS 101466]ETN42856.1 hypothetical protein HMPREF1541_02014 [Cyphellophora europaea CBS 101466]